MKWLETPNGFAYLDLDYIQEKSTPRNPYASGYGKKILTAYKVLHDSRFYRVYCSQFSNAGSCYIRTNAQNVLVNLRNQINDDQLCNYRNKKII